MEKLELEDFDELHQCPWDKADKSSFETLYFDSMKCEVVRCKECGAVFAKNRLNTLGLKKYWADYLTRVHVHDDAAVRKRNQMYKVDFNYIHEYVPTGKVLDVGCGNGSFMELFQKNGYKVHGVEFGKEAAIAAKKEHTVFYGEFPKMDFQEQYDLVIFRGVLQYVPNAQSYLEKAISLLSDRGAIFITAQPNMDSFCFKLFQGNFTQPVTGADFLGYTEKMLTDYFTLHGLNKVGEQYFYENTPYADIENDIGTVAQAIKCRRMGKKIDFKAPAFWGNIMTLVYERRIKDDKKGMMSK